MAVFRTTFPVQAPADVVWEVLTDFARYPEWNPSLPSVTGEAVPGSTLTMVLHMPGRPSPTVTAQVLAAEPGRRLTWHGNVGADRLFCGARDFVLEPQADGTTDVTHVEDVRGLLVPLFRLAMGGAIQRHHDGVNAALAQRAEGAGPA